MRGLFKGSSFRIDLKNLFHFDAFELRLEFRLEFRLNWNVWEPFAYLLNISSMLEIFLPVNLKWLILLSIELFRKVYCRRYESRREKNLIHQI